MWQFLPLKLLEHVVQQKEKEKQRLLMKVEPKRPRATRGRTKNSPNYTQQDLDVLLDITREVLPIGARGWEEVGRRFNEIAIKMSRPTRPAKSLELKVKNLVKTTKPTGSATVPEHVQQALEIDDLINTKAGTIDIDDDEIVDVNSDDNNDDDDDGDAPEPQKEPKVQYIARHSKTPTSQPTPSGSQIRNNNQTFLTNIGLALDPSSRQARQEGFQIQFIQNQQIATLTQQLRDALKRVDSLSTQLSESERRHQEAERRADRAEWRFVLSSHRNQHEQRANLPPPIHNPVFPHNFTPRRRFRGFSDDEDHISRASDSPVARPHSARSYQSTSHNHADSSHHASGSSSRRIHTEPTPDHDNEDAETDCSQPL
ncbi:hypothetical protein Agabi119p4_8537 [Agaricus bisporus var. burnettii]|uniref:DUF6818 domain-containing protein n=1 Tax=Agaricus bisporus var. burnettii TaxID=192524 RepID=A0A8H7C6E9_AGABI|nr:hypothetical protein Agabi119p4_8537 [Agaricus bisporus var. burnettii]